MNTSAEKIGPYELRYELGRGAMAKVWLAWDTNLERKVAIKEPLFDTGFSQAVLDEMGRRFVAEGRAAARLSHPGIVAVYAADVWDHRPAIVMELVEGMTLSSLLEHGPLSPNDALSVLDQLLDAVGYAHEKGVVHRDIKPDNIFITSDGHVKLADFGIARVDTGATRATVAGSVLGTPGYMSPEQARGIEVDARSDLFSVAVVAYEMLVGRNPFGSGEPTTLLYRIVHEEAPELPASAIAGLPADLRPAIMTALAKDPDDRPASAASFKQMLHGDSPTIGVVANTTVVPAEVIRQRNTNTPSWLPYVIVGCVATIALLVVFISATNGAGGGSASDQQPNSTEQPANANSTEASAEESAQESAASKSADTTSAESPYYVAVSEGYVAVYSNSSATPYEVTDVDVTNLGPDSAHQLDDHIGCPSIEKAATIVEGLRSEAAANRAQREEETRIAQAKSQPPIFTWGEASSELPPDQYTSYYGANNVLDNDFTTAWNEGATGNGIGEWISVNASTPQWTSGVEIVTGYPKTSDVYYKNNRARDITIQLSDGYEQQVTLADAYREYQRITFDDYHQTTFIRVRIDSIYEGDRWDDASIDEIRAF